MVDMRPLLHRSRPAILAIIAFAATACANNYDMANRGLGVLPPPAPVPAWMGPVAPAAALQLRGAAAVLSGNTPSSVSRYSEVLVSLWNGIPGQQYGWTLHSGNCASVGAPVGASGVLATYPDGSARADAVLPQPLTASAPYAVVITPSAGADTQPAACADLAYQTLVLDRSGR